MANITRAELNASNQQKIKGPGKVSKQRHFDHNTKMADYIDSKVPFNMDSIDQGDETGILIDENPNEEQNKMIGRQFSLFVGDNTFYIEGTHFEKNPEDNFITMINGWQLSVDKTYTLFPKVI